MEGMHLDVHGLKDEMQRSMACVGRSTDNVVCDLTPIVEFQGNVLIGVASTVNIYIGLACRRSVVEDCIEVGCGVDLFACHEKAAERSSFERFRGLFSRHTG